MDLFQTESGGVWLIAALAFIELATLPVVLYLSYRRRRSGGVDSRLSKAVRKDPKWVAREIKRMCSGKDPNEALLKQMTREERALFEVSIIDALNGGAREEHHRLRSALIKYGYDEQCSRRLMSGDFSDQVRATAVLKLLRPQWRETDDHRQLNDKVENKPLARAASRSTGPLDSE